MIQHVKDDPILQVSSQEPPASSKYDFEDVILTKLAIEFYISDFKLFFYTSLLDYRNPNC